MAVEALNTSEVKKQESSERPFSLIALSQTFLCFDLESREDAAQQIEIRLTANSDVAWRMRTNAPTRYIVNPRSGILTTASPVAKVSVQLVDNNYHPSHELIVQAVQLQNGYNTAEVWKSECAKILSHIQTIKLELTTTIVSFDVPSRDAQANKLLVEKILLRDGLSREEKVKELRNILQMLEADRTAIANNISKAERLTEMLKKSIHERQGELQKLKEKCGQKNRELMECKQKAARMDEQQVCTLS